MHSYQDQFIQPGWAECFFSILSLGLRFACSFVLFDLFVCLSPFFCVSLGSGVVSLTVLGASVTNLNEPSGALATSTITWVRS